MKGESSTFTVWHWVRMQNGEYFGEKCRCGNLPSGWLIDWIGRMNPMCRECAVRAGYIW